MANELKMGKSGPPYDQLVQTALSLLTDLAKKNYHPVVRYNAMLMIGSLNRVESGVSQPPSPCHRSNVQSCLLLVTVHSGPGSAVYNRRYESV